ncbi:ankyrin [Hypoxylon sp. FL0543]|nr:ankyrin [Hypoxylon sp. FL0543]
MSEARTFSDSSSFFLAGISSDGVSSDGSYYRYGVNDDLASEDGVNDGPTDNGDVNGGLTNEVGVNGDASSNHDTKSGNLIDDRLPAEIIREIGSYLPQCDRARLAQTCRKFNVTMTVMMCEEDERQDYHALWWACSHNRHTLLRQLLDCKPELVNYRFQSTRVPSQKRAGFKHLRLGATPLVLSMYYGAYNVMRMLLDRGADVNLPDVHPLPSGSIRFYGHNMRWYPINWAVSLLHERDFEHCLRLLIDAGANINQFPELAMPLEEFGSSWVPSSGDTMPLFQMLNIYPVLKRPGGTSYQDQLDIRHSKLKTLLQLGADPTAVEPLTGYTPIFRIALSLAQFKPWPSHSTAPLLRHEVDSLYEDHVIPHAKRMIRALIESGCDPKIMCWENAVVQSPLHLLCTKSDRYEVLINVLLEAGVDINTADTQGQTPLHRLMHFLPSDHKILRRFIRNGAMLDTRDNLLDTPLHTLCRGYTSCQSRLQQAIKVLLWSGADPLAREVDGRTPREILEARQAPAWEETLDILHSAEERMKNRLRRGTAYPTRGPGPSPSFDPGSSSSPSRRRRHRRGGLGQS